MASAAPWPGRGPPRCTRAIRAPRLTMRRGLTPDGVRDGAKRGPVSAWALGPADPALAGVDGAAVPEIDVGDQVLVADAVVLAGLDDGLGQYIPGGVGARLQAMWQGCRPGRVFQDRHMPVVWELQPPELWLCRRGPSRGHRNGGQPLAMPPRSSSGSRAPVAIIGGAASRDKAFDRDPHREAPVCRFQFQLHFHL
jgi:hypothetical protein